MASAFAHIMVPAVAYVTLTNKVISLRLFVLCAILSVMPDADVIAFSFGIPYESQWGHRGFTHSLFFSMLVALFCTLFWHKFHSHPTVVFVVCFISCASHALLDGMTNGGLGVALYWPFDHERHFLPYRPIQVSPIGIKAFFSEHGLKVIRTELIWIFLPAILVAAVGVCARTRCENIPTRFRDDSEKKNKG